MIFYCLFFFICLYIDKQKQNNENSCKFLVVCLFAFLCFGYMTGSDWRSYELDYINNYYGRSNSYGEIAFSYLGKFAHSIIPDFWLYNGLCKILFLSALLKFIQNFTPHNYLTLAISFAGSLLFMIIDCPMRFMLALTCILFAIPLLLKEKTKRRRIIGYSLLALSVLFHLTSVLVIIFLLTMPLSKKFAKLKTIYIFAAFLVFFTIASISQVYEFIFQNIVPLLAEDRFSGYMDADIGKLWSVGRIKSIIYFLMLLYFRNEILELKYGKEIYYFACLGSILGPIMSIIPTLFRINILNGYFSAIALATIVSQRKRNTMTQLCGTMVILVSFAVLCKYCKDSYKYTPYSNSIPYIITQDHLPYSYRSSYNPNNHDTYFWR